MPEEQNLHQDTQDVSEETTQQQEPGTEEQQNHQSVQSGSEQEESIQARNFKELKRITQNFKSQAETLQKENEELKKHFQQQQQPKQTEESSQDSDDPTIDDDDFVDGRHFKKVYKTQKQIAEENKRMREQMEIMMAERAIEREAPDYYNIVTNDSVETLKNLYPNNARSIANMSNKREQALALYEAIRGYGLDKMQDYQAKKDQVQQNAQKPQALGEPAATQSPMARAAGMQFDPSNDKQKRLYYEEMKRYQKNYRRE